MNIPLDSQNQGFEKNRQGMRAFSQSGEIPSLEGTGTRALESWFLGPKAENVDELERLAVEAIRDQAFWRRNFHPGDPTHITEEIKRSPEYLQAMDSLKEGYRVVLQKRSSVDVKVKACVRWLPSP